MMMFKLVLKLILFCNNIKLVELLHIIMCCFEIKYHSKYTLWFRYIILLHILFWIPHNVLFIIMYYLIYDCYYISGHFVAPLAAHMFCNHMGFPNFSEIFYYPLLQRLLIISNFVLGFTMWCYLLTPLTAPQYYDNKLHWVT